MEEDLLDLLVADAIVRSGYDNSSDEDDDDE